MNGATDIRYPIGKLELPKHIDAMQRKTFMEALRNAPAEMRAAVSGLDDDQLDTPYREGGWTIRQVVHHTADSHIIAYARFKFAVAEPGTPVTVYDENLWADLPDAATLAPEVSLTLLSAIHNRWMQLAELLPEDAFKRSVKHPERGNLTADDLLALYSWHGRHHVAHITAARERLGWR